MAIRPPWTRGESTPTEPAKRPTPEAMTLSEHLKELRRRLIVSLLAAIAAGIVAFALYNDIFAILVQPYCDAVRASHAAHPNLPTTCNLFATTPLQGFGVRLQIATYGGLFLASPVILWQIWRFITPGLNPKEKRYAVPFITSSIVLFTSGAAVAYLVSPKALGFLGSIGGPHLTQIYSPTAYLHFIVVLMAAFGIAFEMPVVLICLEIAGVLSPARLASWRRKAIVVIFALAAIFIPSSDPFSLFAMAIPMCLFYEGAIIVGRILRR
ncbi:MAG: twin-arginine translocase subunit TatC [Acidimicrobiales bacterium]